MRLSNNQQAFLALVRAGLWENDVQLSLIKDINYKEIYRLAEEQSVMGLVAAGLEHVIDIEVPKEMILLFFGAALQIEQRNLAMNQFVATLIDKLRKDDIYVLLLKGQGIAQCYERPLWRTCGDVDLFLSDNNYEKAKSYLQPLASSVEVEYQFNKHIALTIESWTVELHGSLRGDVLRKIDKVLDAVQKDVFYCGNVRSWMNGQVLIFLPGVDNDVFFVFSHILDHFYHGGVGIRQICDWCRLLWTYRGQINNELLEERLRNAGILTEWKAFASFAVEYLGASANIIPLYSMSKCWSNKAWRINSFIIKTGNFGHNLDFSCYNNHSYLMRKVISFCRHTSDCMVYFSIFPLDAIKIWAKQIFRGVIDVFRKRQ